MSHLWSSGRNTGKVLTDVFHDGLTTVVSMLSETVESAAEGLLRLDGIVRCRTQAGRVLGLLRYHVERRAERGQRRQRGEWQQ